MRFTCRIHDELIYPRSVEERERMSNKILAYRPDIDGLRALAVLAVVIFHFNKEWLPGGFIGVDIFFVISGYLITGIIFRQISTEAFTFTEFYIRRARRILPAALFLILITTIFGLAFMVPMDIEELAYSSIASTLSVANIYFWKFLDTGYFAASADMVPLLHMWSLGVEEQFYLVWPALIFFIFRIGGRNGVISAALLIATVSFLYGESKLESDASFAYYMLPSRAGELLIGALAFFASESWKHRISRTAAQALAMIGLLAVAGSIVFISESHGFPGLISLIPSLGVAAIILGGAVTKTVVGCILSLRPLTFIGLLSFSLYLWHWPILAFYRYAYGQPGGTGYVICGFLIIMATLMSYYFIEVPFRRPAKKIINFKSMAVSLSAALTLAISYHAIGSKGLIKEFSPAGYHSKILSHFNQTKAAYRYNYNCQFAEFNKDLIDSKHCIIGPIDQKPSVLIFGDSNAAHFVGYWKTVAESKKITMRNISHNSCIPLSGNKSRPYVTEGSRDSCEEFNKQIREYLPAFETIIIGADWEGYKYRSKTYISDIENLIKEMSATGKTIVISLKVPIFKDYDRTCDSKAIKIPYMNCIDRGRYADTGETELNNEIITIANKYSNVSTFSLRDYICKQGICSAYLNGNPIYFDFGHLSMAGSEQIGKLYLSEGKTPDFISVK
jgi:peptidoglycan/LPS O-acetylase OafA/YrhL